MKKLFEVQLTGKYVACAAVLPEYFNIDSTFGKIGCGIVIVSCIRNRCACLYYCRNSNAGEIRNRN